MLKPLELLSSSGDQHIGHSSHVSCLFFINRSPPQTGHSGGVALVQHFPLVPFLASCVHMRRPCDPRSCRNRWPMGIPHLAQRILRSLVPLITRFCFQPFNPNNRGSQRIYNNLINRLTFITLALDCPSARPLASRILAGVGPPSPGLHHTA